MICSGCRRSVVAVKSLMSEKKIVSLLALGVDRHILLAAEDALVDLRRKIARDLHRQRSEKLVRGLKLAVHALDRRGLTPLQADEGRPAGRHAGAK